MFLIAVPVQSQPATQTPAAPARLTNPTGSDIAACGLPTTWAQFNDSATVTTFNMTADCTFNGWDVQANLAFLYFTAGEFTINGNGHSIIGPNTGFTIYVQNAGTVLNLNNVTIRGNTAPTAVITVTSSARLNARRVIFRDNASAGPVLNANNGEAHLEDVQFLDNNVTNEAGIVVSNGTDGLAVITNGLFRGNTVNSGRIISVTTSGSFRGSSLTISDNTVRSAVWSQDGTRVTFQNVQFLNNRQTANTDVRPRGSAITVIAGGRTTITNGIFRGNRNVAGETNVITSVSNVSGTPLPAIVQFQGCITFENNVQSDGSTAASDYGTYNILGGAISSVGRVTDSRTGSCPGGIGFIPFSVSRPKKKAKETAPTPTSTPRPAYGASYVALQTATGMTFEATYGLDSGVHFRQLDGAGIGIQSIIDAGYLAALDVYGYVEQGVEVCFPQIGRVIFLDARTMPRAITALDATIRDGMTCVYLNSPGSLVLLPN